MLDLYAVYAACALHTNVLTALLADPSSPVTSPEVVNARCDAFTLRCTQRPGDRFATLDDFYKGPEHLIGIPNPKVREGVEKEHCARGNAAKSFTSSNYNVTTCPATEWEFVVCPKETGADYPHTPRDRTLWKSGHAWKGEHGRDVIKLADVLSNAAVQHHVNRAGLIEVEVICLRLYTGAVELLV
jgi:hypothetical protein